MKVALCLHGYFNSLTDNQSYGIDGYNHLYRRVYQKLGVKPDVFIHSWEPHLQEQICKLYNPVAFTFQPQVSFERLIEERGLSNLQQRGTPRPPQSVLSHFYSIQKVFRLCYDHTAEYNVVIKARFDIGRINRNPNRTPGQCITFNPDIEQDKIYMADWEMFDQGPADMWFYGSQPTMFSFMEIYDMLAKYFYLDSEFHEYAKKISNNYGDLSNSVIFYKWWMEKRGLWDKKEPLECVYE